jgi:hypothetical protein
LLTRAGTGISVSGPGFVPNATMLLQRNDKTLLACDPLQKKSVHPVTLGSHATPQMAEVVRVSVVRVLGVDDIEGWRRSVASMLRPEPFEIIGESFGWVGSGSTRSTNAADRRAAGYRLTGTGRNRSRQADTQASTRRQKYCLLARSPTPISSELRGNLELGVMF